MRAVRDKFVERCRLERAELPSPESLSVSDHDLVGEAAHKVAGLAGMLGFGSLSEAAVHLDQAVADHGDVEQAYRRYIEELNRISRN